MPKPKGELKWPSLSDAPPADLVQHSKQLLHQFAQVSCTMMGQGDDEKQMVPKACFERLFDSFCVFHEKLSRAEHRSLLESIQPKDGSNGVAELESLWTPGAVIEAFSRIPSVSAFPCPPGSNPSAVDPDFGSGSRKAPFTPHHQVTSSTQTTFNAQIQQTLDMLVHQTTLNAQHVQVLLKSNKSSALASTKKRRRSKIQSTGDEPPIAGPRRQHSDPASAELLPTVPRTSAKRKSNGTGLRRRTKHGHPKLLVPAELSPLASAMLELTDLASQMASSRREKSNPKRRRLGRSSRAHGYGYSDHGDDLVSTEDNATQSDSASEDDYESAQEDSGDELDECDATMDSLASAAGMFTTSNKSC